MSEETVKLKIPKIHFFNGKLWFVVALILAIALVVVFVKADFGKTVPAEVAANHLVDFLNQNSKVGNVTLANVSEVGDLYKVVVAFDGGQTSLYITKDGEYFIQQAIPIGAPKNEESEKIVSVKEDDDAVKGDENAPVTIIEFSDFECPFCGRFYNTTYSLLVSEYIETGKVKLVFRDFPLTNIHKNAQKSAEAAECIREQLGDEGYFDMHDLLFENQKALDVESLKEYAYLLGVNQEEFDSCLDSGKFAGEVQKDLKEGQQAGVRGTPAFFINGRMIEGAQPFAEFQRIIDEELAKVGVEA